MALVAMDGSNRRIPSTAQKSCSKCWVHSYDDFTLKRRTSPSAEKVLDPFVERTPDAAGDV